jgi:hypothetical protein
MARPTAFKAEYVAQAKKLAATLGATDVEIAMFFGVSDRTIYRWKLDHPAFAKALKVGKAPANERVKRSLYLRAVGYSHPAEEVFCSNGKVTRVQTVKHYPPDTAAAIFYLCNRDKENWRQKNQTEHTGPGGGPIQSITSPLSADELRRIAMELAAKV